MTWKLFGLTFHLVTPFLLPVTPNPSAPWLSCSKFQLWRATCRSLFQVRPSGLLPFLRLSSHCSLCLECLNAHLPL